jgi:cytochrome P450
VRKEQQQLPPRVIISMNSDSKNWENPHEFKPERFLEKDNLRSKVFFLFGGGHRMCIGKKIAHLEVSCIFYFNENRVERFGSQEIIDCIRK